MFSDYHRAIVDSQYAQLASRRATDGWSNVSLQHDDACIYVKLQVAMPEEYSYVCRIDMSGYPVDPYWIGFINPDLPRERWRKASDSDPRFWPWSPMPGLHGSFNIVFLGPFRAFWCRECTFPFFYYHGDRRWAPNEWPLDRVVAHLRDAVIKAEPPSRWRPIQRTALLAAAANEGINLPDDAGLGAK
jgi:hypothetical protein